MMDERQFRVAWLLARYFGHQWGTAYEYADDEFRLYVDDERTTKKVLEFPIGTDTVRHLTHLFTKPGPMGWGIDEPRVDGDGNIVHVTAGGRFEYVIEPDGSFTVLVNRGAGGSLCLMSFRNDLSVVLRGTTEVEWRHVYAAHKLASFLVHYGGYSPVPDEQWEAIPTTRELIVVPGLEYPTPEKLRCYIERSPCPATRGECFLEGYLPASNGFRVITEDPFLVRVVRHECAFVTSPPDLDLKYDCEGVLFPFTDDYGPGGPRLRKEKAEDWEVIDML